MDAFFLSLLGDLVLGVVGIAAEFLLEVTRILNEDKQATPVAITAFVVGGALLGAVSGAILSSRVVPNGAPLGISLIVTPVVFAALAHIGGGLRSRRHQISHLATWYGGAAMGLGLAAGRLGALRMMGQV